jgi:hypothetical protein
MEVFKKIKKTFLSALHTQFSVAFKFNIISDCPFCYCALAIYMQEQKVPWSRHIELFRAQIQNQLIRFIRRLRLSAYLLDNKAFSNKICHAFNPRTIFIITKQRKFGGKSQMKRGRRFFQVA